MALTCVADVCACVWRATQHDDHWCVEHRNITEAHPKSVTEDNVTVAYVDREFMSGEVLVSGLDNYDMCVTVGRNHCQPA